MKSFRHHICRLSAVVLIAAALPLSAKPTHPPAVGDRVPLFCVCDQDGCKWRLADHLGKSLIFLYFYPEDGGPGSTDQACFLRDNIVELNQAGVHVVGVSFDNREKHQDFIFKYGLNFPLLTDVCGQIADAYGVRLGKNRKMDRRVSFLIGMDGRIVHITDSPDPSVHLRELAGTVANMRVSL
jgi:peroxiredoxin Q/BCP